MQINVLTVPPAFAVTAFHNRNIRRLLCSIALILPLAFPLSAQNAPKPRLGILPFAGGTGGDGETIAGLLSIQKEIMNVFTVVPRTSVQESIINEQKFQESGFTDTDTLAELGKRLNAEFVVSGHIRKLGDRNLIITTIVHVQSLELLAGDYREYGQIEEIKGKMPDIAKIIIKASKRDTGGLPRLGIMPFINDHKDINMEDAETLAQILTIEVANTGKFAALPRTSNVIQDALKEIDYQTKGYTAEDGAAALGAALKADYVLSTRVGKLGTLNLFIASILSVDGSQLAGEEKQYNVVEDGMKLMGELALALTNPVKAKPSRGASRFWSAGLSLGVSFSPPETTWLIFTPRFTLAPLPYSFLEIGCDLGFLAEGETVGLSIYPFAHITGFLPFASEGDCYLGAGGGWLKREYMLLNEETTEQMDEFAADFIIGLNLRDLVDISYTLIWRIGSATISHKVLIGGVFRFKAGKQK
jgi:TolB-like protein